MAAERRAVLVALVACAAAGCGGDEGSSRGASGAAGAGGAIADGAAGLGGGADGGAGVGVGGVGGGAGAGAAGGMAGAPPADAGSDAPSRAPVLLGALGTTTWHGLVTRDGRERAVEVRFDAPRRLWGELQNPYGPARVREMRAMVVGEDGATVDTTVTSPEGWPIHPENGRRDAWTVEVIEGTPRRLRTARGAQVEVLDEGPWPEPGDGLTATVRVFPSSGPVNDALCGAGGLGSIDYATLWEFARGGGPHVELGSDVAVGVPLDEWLDPTGNNQFAVTDVPGFDRLGGTHLSDQFDFVVRYAGTLAHPGGSVSLRERDDQVQDALWAWLGPGVGGATPSDLFLEVHDLIWPDVTPNEPSGFFPAGDLDVEVMIVRCTGPLEPVTLEVRQGAGAWQLVGSVAASPQLDPATLPPLF